MMVAAQIIASIRSGTPIPAGSSDAMCNTLLSSDTIWDSVIGYYNLMDLLSRMSSALGHAYDPIYRNAILYIFNHCIWV